MRDLPHRIQMQNSLGYREGWEGLCPRLPRGQGRFIRNPLTTNHSEGGTLSLWNGVLVGFCANGEYKERCTGDRLPRSDGYVAYECIKYTQTTYETSSPMWIQK